MLIQNNIELLVVSCKNTTFAAVNAKIVTKQKGGI